MEQKWFRVIRIASGEKQRKTGAEYVLEQEYFNLIWLIQGEGEVVLDFQSIQISENQLICSGPGTLARCKAKSNTEGWIFGFHPDLLSFTGPEVRLDFEASLLQRKERLLAETDETFSTKAIPVFDALARMQENAQAIEPEFLAGYLRVLLLQTLRIWSAGSGKQSASIAGPDAIWFHFNQLLETHFRHQRLLRAARQPEILSLRLLPDLPRRSIREVLPPRHSPFSRRRRSRARRRDEQPGSLLRPSARSVPTGRSTFSLETACPGASAPSRSSCRAAASGLPA